MSQSNDGVFRLPPLLPNTSSPSSNSNSLTSTHGIGFWKADSQSPIATNAMPTVEPHRHPCSWQVSQLNLKLINLTKISMSKTNNTEKK